MVDGHYMKAEADGSIDQPGTADNTLGSLEIYDQDGNVVTQNYHVVVKAGVLEIIDEES